MAHRVNNERFTDPEKIEEWFTRNCTWTIERACTLSREGRYSRLSALTLVIANQRTGNNET